MIINCIYNQMICAFWGKIFHQHNAIIKSFH